MSEKITALLYILAISFIGFFLIKRITKDVLTSKEVSTWNSVWFAITLSAYLIPNFWLFLGVAFFIISYFSRATEHKIALYIILLFSFPIFNVEIPGLGGMNYFFNCNFPRFLSLTILLPEALRLTRSERDFRFGSISTDIWVLLYALVWFGLTASSYGITSGLRTSLYTLLELGLPYFVFSRGFKNLGQLKTIFFAFVAIALIISLIGVFENRKSWIVYNSLYYQFGSPNPFTYTSRGNDLRAIATLGQPIALGFFIVVAISFYTFIYRDIRSKLFKNIALLTLLMGLLAPISRGPWVGFVVFFMIYTFQGKNKIKKISALSTATLVVILALNYLPNGQKYIDLIPFIGKTDAENVTYREQVFEKAMIVIARQPFFGAQGTLSFREEPEMLALKQGQGIVDVVNSYVLEALQAGCVTLFIYLMIYTSTMFRVISFRSRIKRVSDDLHRLGSSFIAINIAIMVMIATVSLIMHIPYIISIVIGLSIAYTRMVNIALKQNKPKGL